MTDSNFPPTTKICYPKDITWVEDKDWCNEAVLVYFINDDGGMGYVQIVYSSMSINVTTQVTAKFWNKDVNQFATKTGKGSNLSLSEDKLSSYALDTEFTSLSTDEFHYKIGANFEPKKIKYDLDFTSTCPYGYQTDKIQFDPENIKNGYCIHRFIPTGRVKGTVVINEKTTININGTALYSHAVQQNPQYCKRWNLITMNNGTDGLMMLEFISKSTSVGKAGLVLDNKLVGVATDCTVKQVCSVIDKDTDYEVPSEMKYTITGKTIEGGKPFTIDLTMKPTNQIDRIDCLSFLPFLVRKFIQKFISKPFIYQWLDEGVAEVTIGDEKRTIKGLVLQETSHVSK